VSSKKENGREERGKKERTEGGVTTSEGSNIGSKRGRELKGGWNKLKSEAAYDANNKCEKTGFSKF